MKGESARHREAWLQKISAKHAQREFVISQESDMRFPRRKRGAHTLAGIYSPHKDAPERAAAAFDDGIRGTRWKWDDEKNRGEGEREKDQWKRDKGRETRQVESSGVGPDKTPASLLVSDICSRCIFSVCRTLCPYSNIVCSFRTWKSETIIRDRKKKLKKNSVNIFQQYAADNIFFVYSIIFTVSRALIVHFFFILNAEIFQKHSTAKISRAHLSDLLLVAFSLQVFFRYFSNINMLYS